MSEKYKSSPPPAAPGYTPQYDDQPPPYSAHAPQEQSYGYQPEQGSYRESDDGPGNFRPPKRQESFGPPVAGGFQHGYEGGQFGAYDASNPQGHMGYLYDPYPFPSAPAPTKNADYHPQRSSTI